MTRNLASKVFEYISCKQGHDVTKAALASMGNPMNENITAKWIFQFLKERVNR